MILYQWAMRHNIPLAAIKELEQLFGIVDRPDIPTTGLSEAAVQANVRLEASRKGSYLFRNNVGAGKLENGDFIRWGLANDSTQLNAKIKSADLIGIRPVMITPEMVGQRIGQFISRETKHGAWRYTGRKEEKAQLAWAEFVVSLGGDACFATGEGTL